MKRYLTPFIEGYTIGSKNVIKAASLTGVNATVFSAEPWGCQTEESATYVFRTLFAEKYYSISFQKIRVVPNAVINLKDNGSEVIRIPERKKVVVIPNGIKLEEFKGLKRRSKDCMVILYVGRLEKYKGVHYFIETLLKIDNDIVLEIVGKGSYKRRLVKLTRKLGIEDRVKFFQDLPRNELLQKYADADLFVLLSKHEAYGITVAEALASGTPCIVANASALKEWVDDKNCFGINYPINVNELGNLIDNVVGKDVKELRLSDWNEITEKLVNLYECC